MLNKARRDGALPRPLQRKPVLDLDLVWIYECYDEMNKGREDSFNGPRRLSYKDIVAYTSYIGIVSTIDNLERFARLIYELDEEYFDWLELERQKKRKSKPR